MLKFSGCPRLTWGRGPSARGCGRVWSRGWHRAAECGRDVRSATIRLSTPTRRVAPHGVLLFPPTARRGLGHGRPVSAPPARHGNAAGGVAMGGVTPRQACPRPSGLGRNLRSKTRWFTGFCNSHQVSHFATFFIDARAGISVAESHFVFWTAATSREREANEQFIIYFLGASSAQLILLGEGNHKVTPALGSQTGDQRPTVACPLLLHVNKSFWYHRIRQ